MGKKTISKGQFKKPANQKKDGQKFRFRLTPRDMNGLLALYDYRVLDSYQWARLIIDPQAPQVSYAMRKKAQHRLKLLTRAGYVAAGEQWQKYSQGRAPKIYALSEGQGGAQLVAESLNLPIEQVLKRSNPGLLSTSVNFLHHLQQTNTIRILLTTAALRQGFEVKAWLDDYFLHKNYDRVTIKGPRGGEQTHPLIPDGWFWLWNGRHHFCQVLECDLGSIVEQYSSLGAIHQWKKDWARRVRLYKQWYRGGQYVQRFPEAQQDKNKQPSMRVLVVTSGTEAGREASLKEVVERVAGKDKYKFWFCTFERFEAADCVLTDKIWKTSKDDQELFSLIW